MSPRSVHKDQLFDLIEPVCADSGYELVDLEYKPGNRGWVLRLYIDHAAADAASDGSAVGASAINFSDCEALSRELSAVLDVSDPLPHAYHLEVSSPGLDRPLRTADHFRRYLGEEIKATLHRGLEGRKNFRGRLVAVAADGSTASVETDSGLHKLPVDDVARAHLVPNWNELLKGSAK